MNPPYFVTCDIKDAYRVNWSLYKNEKQYPHIYSGNHA